MLLPILIPRSKLFDVLDLLTYAEDDPPDPFIDFLAHLTQRVM
jgi:hypothetical protein